jgi:hypothetical protein
MNLALIALWGPNTLGPKGILNGIDIQLCDRHSDWPVLCRAMLEGFNIEAIG